NTVWFGEIIPMERIDRCLFAIEQCDLLLIVGTSGVVEPAASMGFIAKKSEKPVVEINIERTPGTDLYDVSVMGKSAEILPLLTECEISQNRM
ncbi:MAG: NAD-dependent deacylase, partial [Candidatus Dadabacteria bacterium]|nr:NAD-dependent deacylase [Candidatus Dadabacteria bacterium]